VLNDQAVGKGLDAELGEEGGLRGAHLVPLLDDRHVGGDLDGTPDHGERVRVRVRVRVWAGVHGEMKKGGSGGRSLAHFHSMRHMVELQPSHTHPHPEKQTHASTCCHPRAPPPANSLCDLGGDVEDLEEGGLRRVHAGAAGRDDHTVGGHQAHTRRGPNLELGNDVTDLHDGQRSRCVRACGPEGVVENAWREGIDTNQKQKWTGPG
jgi:hypothetical protein